MGNWLSRLVLLLLCAVGAGLSSACGPDFGCLAAGTPVATPCGSVPIESLRVGDVVWSVDPATSVLYPGRLVAVRALRRPCLELTTQTGRRIVATAEHPFFVPGRNEYRPAGEWLAGGGECVALYARGLTAEPVVACEPLPGERWVYDLTVASPHHNFLADAVLVHNKTPAPDDFSPPPAGPIEASLRVRHAVTLTSAVLGPEPFAGFDWGGQTITVSQDDVLIGPHLYRIASALPFDAVIVDASSTLGADLDGYLLLSLPAPVTTVDIEAVVVGTAHTLLQMPIAVRSAGLIGAPVLAYASTSP